MQRQYLPIGVAHFWPFLMSFVVVVGVFAWWSSRDLVEKRISFGEKSLIPGPVPPRKQVGMDYIKAKDWIKAQDKLKESLKKNPNDPEALIFFNNAKVHSTESDKSGSTESYTIAVSVPLPKYENNSLEILRGVAQAQDEINSSGENKENKKILLKVAIASDDDDPEVAKQVATALARNSDVLGVVGHYASDVTIAAKDIYTSKKLVAITPISTSVDLTKNSNPYIFRTVPSDSDSAQALKNYMSQNLNKNNNVAIFYNSNSNYSKSLACEFRNAVVDAKEQKCDFKNFDLNAKGQVRKVNGYDLYKENFNATSSVKQAIDKGTQVLMLAADTRTLPKALDVVGSAKGKNLNILAGDDVYTPDTLKEDAAVGMVVAVFWHIDNAPNPNFVSKSQELWGKTAIVNWRTALAYDATRALIAAIQENQTRGGVQQALLSPKFKTTGASGDIEFCPSGDRKNAKVELVQIVPNTNSSSTPYKFVPVAPRKDKPSGECPGSPTNNNSSPTPTPSPLPTATPTLTSTPTPSSSTTSLESNSVCRLQPESPESYKAVVQSRGLNLREEPRQDSTKKYSKALNRGEIIIVFKDEKNKEGETWKKICVEGTTLEGWVIAKFKGKDTTKKIGE